MTDPSIEVNNFEQRSAGRTAWLEDLLNQPPPQAMRPTFTRWMQAGFLKDLLPIMPTGAKLATGSKVKQDQIGKIPGRYCGDGTWSGMSWRTKEGPHVTVEEEIAAWETWPDNPRVGLIGTEFKAIDADVIDPVLNAKIKAVAFETLGKVSCRIGSPPKFLLMYRLPGNLLKMQLKFSKVGENAGMVEILGHRQQWVVDGIHPTTQRPYYYEGPHPTEVGADLWPETTVEQIETFVAAVVEEVEQLGYSVHIPGRTKAETAQGIKLHRGKSDNPAADGPPEEEIVWDGPDTLKWAEATIAAEITRNGGLPQEDQGSDDRAYRLAGKLKDGPRWGYSLETSTIANLLQKHWAPHFDLVWLADKAERDHANGRGCGPLTSAKRTFPRSTSAETPIAETPFEDPPSAVEDEWPEPFDLFGNLLTPEPELRPDMLPPSIANYAARRAAGLGIELAGVAVPCLVACMHAVHGGYVNIQPRRFDSWTERPALWAANVEPSGSNKSAALNAGTYALRKVEEDWRKQHARDIAVYEQQVEAHKARRVENKEAAENQLVLHNLAPVNAEPVKPTARMLCCDQQNMEGLRDKLTENDSRGLLLAFDELTVFFGSFGQYNGSAGGDRGLACAAWNGGPRNILRAGKTIHVPNWLVSVAGNIPIRALRQIVEKSGLDNDGLLQRFLLYKAKSTGEIVDVAPDHIAEQRYADLIEALTKLEDVVTVELAPDAQPIRDRFEHLALALSEEPQFCPALREHMNKMRGNFARLMLVYHAIEWATGDRATPFRDTRVSAATAQRVYDLLILFFIPTSIQVYAELYPADEDTDAVQLDMVARGLLALDEEERAQPITDRTIYRQCGKLRGEKFAADRQRAIDKLAGYCGWLRPTDALSSSWQVNPKIYDRFTSQRNREKARRETEQRRAVENRRRWHDAYGKQSK